MKRPILAVIAFIAAILLPVGILLHRAQAPNAWADPYPPEGHIESTHEAANPESGVLHDNMTWRRYWLDFSGVTPSNPIATYILSQVLGTAHKGETAIDQTDADSRLDIYTIRAYANETEIDGYEEDLFIDSSGTGKDVTATNSAIVTGDAPKFGNGAGKFNIGRTPAFGMADNLIASGSADFQFGTGDFTIDFWFKPDSYAINKMHVFYHNRTDTSNWFSLNCTNNKPDWFLFLESFVSGGIQMNVGGDVTSLLDENSWNHIAAVRSSGTVYLFVNGVQPTYADRSNQAASIPLFVNLGVFGHPEYASSLGYMDEFRVSKGVARWTTNFTPPSAAYTTDTYTKLLLHCDHSLAAFYIADITSPGVPYAVGWDVAVPPPLLDDGSEGNLFQEGSLLRLYSGNYYKLTLKVDDLLGLSTADDGYDDDEEVEFFVPPIPDQQFRRGGSWWTTAGSLIEERKLWLGELDGTPAIWGEAIWGQSLWQ